MFLNAKDLLKQVGISRATLYSFIKEGLPYKTVSSGRKVYDPDQVCKFIERQKLELERQLSVGQEYTNDEIVKLFCVGNMGGMRKSNAKNALVLISFQSNVDRLYQDYWKGDILYYTGMGQKGEQDINFSQNKTLAGSNNTNITVYLFEMHVKQKYLYRGIVELVDTPFEEKERDSDGQIRTVWKFPLRLVDDSK